jgi:hypothetical protein
MSNIARIDPDIKRGKRTLNLTQEDIFDRIINLRFTRVKKTSDGREVKTYFTLRSDYEPVFDGRGGVSFKRITQKPAIKVIYRQVAGALSINVNIAVTNLFMDTGGDDSPFMAEGNPVKNIVVQMGYIKQFPDDWVRRFDTGMLKRYYDLNNHNITPIEEQEMYKCQLSVDILYAEVQGYPPDQVTVFHGIVGNMDRALIWEHDERDFDPAKLPKPDTAQSGIETVLFYYIQSRFLRSGVEHRFEDEFDENGGIVSRRVFVKGYDRLKAAYAGGSSGPIGEYDTETELSLVRGIMNTEDAKVFGVQFACTDALIRKPLDMVYAYGMTEQELRRVKLPSTPVSVRRMQTLQAQILVIQREYSSLRWYVLV